jgi:hypothetical protein
LRKDVDLSRKGRGKGLIKPLWKGVFNLNREIHVLYAHSYTERQAWVVMCRRLADKTGVRWSTVTNYFNGDKDNFVITKEIDERQRIN